MVRAGVDELSPDEEHLGQAELAYFVAACHECITGIDVWDRLDLENADRGEPPVVCLEA